MRSAFRHEHAGARVRNQLRQGSEQCIENTIHVKVFGKRESGLSQGFCFRPCGICPVKIGSNLVFGFLERGDVERGSPHASDRSVSVSPRKAADPNPANLTVWPNNTKPIFEVSALGRLLELCQYLISIIGMNGFPVRRRLLDQGLTRATSDDFVGRIDVDRSPRLRVDDPEYFLDVVGHLVKLLLAVLKDSLSLLFGAVHLTNYISQQEGEDKHGAYQGNQQRQSYTRRLKIGDENSDQKNR